MLTSAAAAVLQAMFNVVVDQFTLGIGNGAFDRVELLGEIDTGAAIVKHRQNLGEVTLGAFEANDDIWMGCVFHTSIISP